MNSVLIMVFLTVIMIVIAVPFVIRSLLWNRVLKLLRKGQYEKVLVKLDSSMFRMFFKEYDRSYNRLRVYLAMSDNRKVEEQTKLLLDKKLTARQSYQVASETFFYFLDRENQELCEKLLEYIKAHADLDEYAYDAMLYRILIEKKSEDIESVSALLKEKNEENVKKDQLEDQKVQIGILQYLLGVQYSYKKDRAAMLTWLNKAKSNLKNTPYQKKVKSLLQTSAKMHA